MDQAVERRRREDEAVRLVEEIPQLTTFSLELEAWRPGGELVESRHIRRVVVEHAPALFNIPCVDRSCEDGGHDVTRDVMARLREEIPRFEGKHECRGHNGVSSCGRVLRYVGLATYHA